MTVWVIRNGKLVDKRAALLGDAIKAAERDLRADMFPVPMISRLDPYESPISGREITSWGEREREMREHDAFDPRDLPRDHVYEKGRKNQLKDQKNG